MTHSSHDNVASLGSATCNDTSVGGNGVSIETDLTESAKEGGEAGVQPVQTDAAIPAPRTTTAMAQASTSLIPKPAKQLSAASVVK